MKVLTKPLLISILGLALFGKGVAEEEAAVSIYEKHAEGSDKLADEQDELSADVQQLVIEQTVPEVIELLSEVESIMDETTDFLAERDTGGETIAAQTEIIERIHLAAKAKQQSGQGQQGEAGSAMMDMMERMMGKKPGEGKQGEGKDGKPGEEAGQGNGGDSDSLNENEIGDAGGKQIERTVPKAAGKAGAGVPSEFQSALDAYNRGLEELSK